MISKEILVLGEKIEDKASGLSGILVMCQIGMSGNTDYLFQPGNLNLETMQPAIQFWVDEKRVVGGTREFIDLPLNILDTLVEDTATGFNGLAVAMYYHLNGCIHIDVKPRGVIEKTGQPIKSMEFDIRRLKGDAIKQLSPEEYKKSKQEEPSPESHPERTEK